MSFLKVSGILVLFAGIGLAVASKDAPTDADLARTVSTAMSDHLATEFQQLGFEVRTPAATLAPTLLYEGKHSAILALSRPRVRDYLYNLEVVIAGLARTENGRYFEFSYTSAVKSNKNLSWTRTNPCLEEGCRALRFVKPLSAEGAKSWFFNSDNFTPERYKELFHEDAPPQRLPA